MATIKAEYYRLNGAEWDKYYFKTSADMVEGLNELIADGSTDISQLYGGKNLAGPELTGKEYLGNGEYDLGTNRGVNLKYNVYRGIYTLNGVAAGGGNFRLFSIDNSINLSTLSVTYVSGDYNGTDPDLFGFLAGSGWGTRWVKKQTNAVIKYQDYDNRIGIMYFPDNNAGFTYDNYQFKLQIEEGEEATPYTLPLWITPDLLPDIPEIPEIPEVPEDIITESDYGIVQSFTIESLKTATFKAPVIYSKSGLGGFMNFEIEVFGAGNATDHAGKVKMVCAVSVGNKDGNVLYPSDESERARIVEFQGSLSTRIYLSNPVKDGDFVTFQITRRNLNYGAVSPRVVIRTIYTGGTPDDYNNLPLDTRWEVELSPQTENDTRRNKLYNGLYSYNVMINASRNDILIYVGFTIMSSINNLDFTDFQTLITYIREELTFTNSVRPMPVSGSAKNISSGGAADNKYIISRMYASSSQMTFDLKAAGAYLDTNLSIRASDNPNISVIKNKIN